jgi:hypothetical protein
MLVTEAVATTTTTVNKARTRYHVVVPPMQHDTMGAAAGVKVDGMVLWCRWQPTQKHADNIVSHLNNRRCSRGPVRKSNSKSETKAPLSWIALQSCLRTTLFAGIVFNNCTTPTDFPTFGLDRNNSIFARFGAGLVARGRTDAHQSEHVAI